MSPIQAADPAAAAAVHYDVETDILYISIREGAEEEFVELGENIILEIDDAGRVIGIEIEEAAKMLRSMPDLLNAIRN